MNNGPSTEELRNYWNNNRQYFDSLAKYYSVTDPEYYNKYVAPFYSNPYVRTAAKGGAKISAVIIALIFLIAGGAAAFFVVVSGSNKKGSDKNKEYKYISPLLKEDTVIAKSDSTANIDKVNTGDYDKGMKFYKTMNYDKAEEYFKQVPKNDKNYKNAQKKLFEIKIIKDALDPDRNSPTKPKEKDNRKQPIEGIH